MFPDASRVGRNKRRLIPRWDQEGEANTIWRTAQEEGTFYNKQRLEEIGSLKYWGEGCTMWPYYVGAFGRSSRKQTLNMRKIFLTSRLGQQWLIWGWVHASISKDIWVMDLLNTLNQEYLAPALGPPGYWVLGTQINQRTEGINHQVEPETNSGFRLGQSSTMWCIEATLLPSHASLRLSILVLCPS